MRFLIKKIKYMNGNNKLNSGNILIHTHTPSTACASVYKNKSIQSWSSLGTCACQVGRNK